MKKLFCIAAILAAAFSIKGFAASPVKTSRLVIVAAGNTCKEDKKIADFVCTGKNDEATINKAIEKLKFGGTVQLLDGDYYLDSFDNEGNSAIFFGYNDGKARAIDIIGNTRNKTYNTSFGVSIHVSKAAYEAMDPEQTYRIFYGTSRIPENDVFYTYTHINNLYFENFKITVPGAKRKIIAIDCRNFGNGSMKTLRIVTDNITFERYTHIKPETPVPGFTGVYSVGSSNEGALGIGYDGLVVAGFYTGIVCHGIDHLIMSDCATARCVVGYEFRGTVHKTLTMINCCDEGNTYLPRFYGRGHLTCIDFNIERFNADYIPDDIEGMKDPFALEEKPGEWHGFLSYTLQGNAFGVNGFWSGQSGLNFKTVDLNKNASEWPF